MLEPRDRALLFRSLHPPSGYRLDRAIGTSFTLDLLALLTAPLAFAFAEWEDDDGGPTGDPVALMHALREHARRVHLFCQAGAIQAPRSGQPLFAYVEPSVIEARAPNANGIFHPKVWVLRFTSSGEPVRYRVLVASRNLTFDRSWDTLLALDGELKARTRAIRANDPLSDFVSSLPSLAVRPLAKDNERAIQIVGDELRRVRFEVPEPFDELRFHPQGIPDYEEHWPLAGGGRRCLVMSPFLTDELLGEIATECADEYGEQRIGLHLVSRPESLQQLDSKTLDLWSDRWVLSADADAEEGDEDTGEDDAHVDQVPATPDDILSGLHAKLVILQRHRRAHVFTGSANATGAAYDRNVEFCVELVGGFHKVGIASLLGSDDDAGVGKLRDLLEPWEPAEPDDDPERELRERLKRKLEEARFVLGAAQLTLHATPASDGDGYDLELRGRMPKLPRGIKVRCWPASRPGHQAAEPRGSGTLAAFRSLSLVELTAFLTVELVAGEKGVEERIRLARHLPLEGAPEDREERLLREILKDKETVLRLLWLLLSSDELAADDLALGGGGAGFDLRTGFGGMPVLEALMRSLARDPKALDGVQRLIDDLGRTEEGHALLPDGLEDIWSPIRAAREVLEL